MGTVMEMFVTDFNKQRVAIASLRVAVFVREQGVPEDMEMDDRDSFCIHFLAQEGSSFVATARLDPGLRGKVGRLAVLASHRHSGVGTRVMDMVHRTARNQGLSEVWCHAQCSAEVFYQKLGYRAVGEPFEEAGIAHITMRCDLF
ncbi:GNAT family N-acetyltransferase [Acidithiobacillus sp. MC6.1]|uniref:GNAT family N-acetyltransferase n=2 Tax=Acidithiobacillus ferrivorans TaxID=160808 RepID=A0A7T5BI98_9PROT|nr:GNAT family N-acetyltransferase [Acidithiobacillus sp. MC6.1]QQD74216.1 GNAT family N-acetyltransferase [Acidithiobacillus ferrivorans]